jgi:hypothetical protein
MINRGAAVILLVVSLVIGNVILFKGFSQGREQSDEEGIYRYPKAFGKFFLFMIPVFAAMFFFIWSSDSKPPEGIGLVVFSIFGIAMVGLPVFGYLYVAGYRVCTDPRGITVTSLSRVRFIPFTDISSIATVRGRGIDYWLFSPDGRCIAKIGGSIQDFDSLQDDVEFATRSRNVMLYEFEGFRGWRERANDPDDDWRTSKGPPLIRDRNRRVGIMTAIGFLLIAALAVYTHFYLR